MGILLKVLQLVAIYMCIGFLFFMIIVNIYEKYGKDRDGYEETMRLVNTPKTMFALALIIGGAWPKFLLDFILTFIVSFKDYIVKHWRNRKGGTNG